MIKLLDLLENKILVPRRSKEERDKKFMIITQKKIQQYIKDGSQGDLWLDNTSFKKLPDELITVGGSLVLNYSDLESLNNLQSVKGNLWIVECKNFKSFGNLEYIGGNLRATSTLIKSYDKIKYIGGEVEELNRFRFDVESLGDLEFVGRINLNSSKIESLGNLTKAKDLVLSHTSLKSLGNLKEVNNLFLYGSMVESLPPDLKVKKYINIGRTPLSEKYTEEEIRQMVPGIKGEIKY